MRILYGVAGEGMGHATRSHAFLADLVGDHEVLVVASGRAHDYLAQHFPEVREILGFSLAYEDNAIRRWETVTQNLRGAVSRWPAQVRSFYEVARDFEADVVVSDFEAFVLTVARRERVPAISVDNIMMLDRCRHDEGIIGDDTLDFELARQIARTKAPGLHWAIVPTFFRPPLRRQATRRWWRRCCGRRCSPPESEPGEHLLVYQTAAGSETLVRTLHKTGLPCRLYGVRRDLTEDLVDGELVYRPFSETGFLDDLRTARGVIAGGGFSLLSECVYLHKPALSIPVAGQFEQTLNARYLERLGYGEYAEAPSEEAILAFLERLPDHERRLEGYQPGRQHRGARRAARAARARGGRSGPQAQRRTGPAQRRRLAPRGRRRDVRRRRAAALRPRARPRAGRDRDRGAVRLGREAADAVPGERAAGAAVRPRARRQAAHRLQPADVHGDAGRLPPAVRVRRAVDGGEGAGAARRLGLAGARCGTSCGSCSTRPTAGAASGAATCGGTAAGSGGCRSTTGWPSSSRWLSRSPRSWRRPAGRRRCSLRRRPSAPLAAPGAAAGRLRRLGAS